ncbi:MAG TPA: HD domain-containing protein [Patescibacteria group bacterium]|nr:HD domain-containing protein [Patescibacteria group bacterium]
MLSKIPKEIIEIYSKIKDSGFSVFFVGGCVRNLILKKDVKDWDLATIATPEDIIKLFPDTFYDNKFGTVGVPVEKPYKQVVEITTFRTEQGFKDFRHPTNVTWGKTIEEDLARRDLTINAIAMDLNAKLIDPFSGQKDIEDKLIRAVGKPEERFKEDALRLIRAIRFASQLDFRIEDKTWNEVKKDAELINQISKERIRDELLKILSSNFPYEGVTLLKESGLLKYILPELLEGKDISQARPGRHHTDDVLTHNLMSLKHCPSEDPIVRFAALIHDVGKPEVLAKDEKGLVIFHNHETVGARVAKEICEKLKFSKKDKNRVVNLIRWHMFTVDEHITDAAIRRFIRRVGVENVKDVIDLRIGDRLGGGTQTAESWRLKLFKKRIEEQLGPKPFSIENLAINGNDIMKELKLKPGPKIGEILQKLFEEVDEDLSKNTREYLIKKIKTPR